MYYDWVQSRVSLRNVFFGLVEVGIVVVLYFGVEGFLVESIAGLFKHLFPEIFVHLFLFLFFVPLCLLFLEFV